MKESKQLLDFLSKTNRFLVLTIHYSLERIDHQTDELWVLYKTTEVKRIYYKTWFSRKRKWRNEQVVTKKWVSMTEAIKKELPENAKILQIKFGYEQALVYYAT